MSIEFFNSELKPKTLEAEVVSQAHRKAKEHSDIERIKPRDFEDIYSKSDIAADLKYVKDTEEKINLHDSAEDKERVKLAIILEEITSEQIELNEWLGPNVTTKKASRFDDLRNGVDEVVEMHEEGSIDYLALAVDVTYSSKGIKDKFDRIRDEIRRGKLSTIKYFESSDGSDRKPLEKVPRVVIGVDSATIAELAKMWLERDNKSLAVHPVQIEMLDEIMMQLKTFRSYAIKIGGKDDIVKIYDKQIAIINRIQSSESKTAIRRDSGTGYIQNDKVFKAIKAELASFAG